MEKEIIMNTSKPLPVIKLPMDQTKRHIFICKKKEWGHQSLWLKQVVLVSQVWNRQHCWQKVRENQLKLD